jgi:hypothetical protein
MNRPSNGVVTAGRDRPITAIAAGGDIGKGSAVRRVELTL